MDFVLNPKCWPLFLSIVSRSELLSVCALLWLFRPHLKPASDPRRERLPHQALCIHDHGKLTQPFMG